VSYEYIVVPATSVDRLVRRNITIVSNTPEIQAVGHAGLGIYQAVFYSAGAVRLTESIRLACDSPGIVMLKTKGSVITEISVSDPNRELGRMHLAVSVKIEQKGEHFEAVWKEDHRMSEVVIDLPQGVYAGSSITVKFK
jgi:chondroitin AC lyase